MGPFNQQQVTNSQQVFTIFVNGDDLPKTYPVGLGYTGIFIDFAGGKFWVKENSSGVPRPLRTFSFEEIFPQPNYQNGSNPGVSREEFNALSAKIDKLLSDLGGVSQ